MQKNPVLKRKLANQKEKKGGHILLISPKFTHLNQLVKIIEFLSVNILK